MAIFDLNQFSNDMYDFYSETSGSSFITYDEYAEIFLRACNQDVLSQMTGKKTSLNLVPCDYGRDIKIAMTDQELYNVLKANQKELDIIEAIEDENEKVIKRTNLIKQIVTPRQIIKAGKWKPELVVNGEHLPIWFNTTLKGVNLRFGFQDEDRSLPTGFSLDDNCVHALLGGITGSGKSVTLHDMIMTLLLEYAPWELNLYLMDFKLVELSKYAAPAAPQVQVVGATDATEYIQSLIKNLYDLMTMRSSNYMKMGIDKVETFRKTYDQAVPATVMIVDEFMQLYSNLKEADDMEGKEAIDRSISAIGRLGRSFKFHMVLSSQDIASGLSDEISKQMGGGVALKSDSSVSKSLIGNDAAAQITEKGIVLVNSNRNRPDNQDGNVKFKSPFIPSDLSDKESKKYEDECIEAIKSDQPLPQRPLPYLKQRLLQLRQLADEMEVGTDLQFFNANDKVSIKEFNIDLEVANNIDKGLLDSNGNPITSDDTDDTDDTTPQDSQVIKTIALGRTTKYRVGNQLETFQLKIIADNNILVLAKNDEDFNYCTDILVQNLSNLNSENQIVCANRGLAQKLQLDKRLPNSFNLFSPKVPEDIMDELNDRKDLISLQLHMLDGLSRLRRKDKETYDTLINLSTQQSPFWSTGLALEFFYRRTGYNQDKFKIGDNIDDPYIISCIEYLEKTFSSSDEDDTPDFEQFFKDKIGDSLDINKVEELLDTCLKVNDSYYEILEYTGLTKELSPKDFKTKFNWFIGIEDLQDITDPDNGYEVSNEFKYFLTEAPKVNIVTIALCNNPIAKITSTLERFNWVIDKTTKADQMELSLPIRKDMTTEKNANYISLQCRTDRSKYVTVKKYSTK